MWLLSKSLWLHRWLLHQGIIWVCMALDLATFACCCMEVLKSIALVYLCFSFMKVQIVSKFAICIELFHIDFEGVGFLGFQFNFVLLCVSIWVYLLWGLSVPILGSMQGALWGSGLALRNNEECKDLLR